MASSSTGVSFRTRRSGIGASAITCLKSVELALAAKRRSAGQELIKDAAQPVDVRLRANRLELPLGLLGCHVRRRSERNSALGFRPQAIGDLGQAEVGDARLESTKRLVLVMRQVARARRA